jgi:hypothetical protein
MIKWVWLMKRNLILPTAILFFFLLCSTFAAGYNVIEFKTLPATITTNIGAFPVTGIVAKTTASVLVNGVASYITEDERVFSTVVDLAQGANQITLRIVDSNGTQQQFSKQITFNPAYSTESEELVYTNFTYYIGTTAPEFYMYDGVIAISPGKNSFLGAFKEKLVSGITMDGSEIVFDNGLRYSTGFVYGARYSTKTHTYTGKTLPSFPVDYGARALFSSNGKAYYSNKKVDLVTNSVEATLPRSIGPEASLSADEKKIILGTGYIDLLSNTFVEKNYSNGKKFYLSMVVLEPKNQYVLNSSYDGALGKINILNAADATILKTFDNEPDYAEDIVFSPNGEKAYFGFVGNSVVNYGGIRIVDMATLEKGNFFTLHGAGSLAIAKDGRLYASAICKFDAWTTRECFYPKDVIGLAELKPINGLEGLELTKVFVFAPNSNGGWHNTVFFKAGTIACYQNSGCGTDGWIGSTSCSGNDVYQTWRAFTCNNPGTASASCSQSDTQKLKQDCGDTTYELWGANYCDGNNVARSRTVNNKGCSTGTCTASDSTEKQTVQTCQYGCANGTCNGIAACSKNSNCGTNGYTGAPFCQSNNVYQNYITYTCNNPGTASSSCSNNTAAQLKQTCQYGCASGTCNAAPGSGPAWKSMNFYESFDTIGGLISDGWSLQGSPQTVAGMQNGATSFGQEDSATHALNGIFNPNIGTIEFSFNLPASVTASPGIGLLEVGTLGQANSMGLFVIPYYGKNVAIMEVRDSANKLTQSWTKTTTIKPNAWHQIVLTWQCNKTSNYVKIYIDGVVGSTNKNACASFNPTGILGIAKVSSYYDKKPVLLDDLRIYNYIKSSSQILKDYKYKVNAMWPNLIEPANGAAINKSRVFSWKANTFTKFKIEISQNSDFSKPKAITGWISGTSTTLSKYWTTIQRMSASDSDKVLYWRVVGTRSNDTEYSEGNAFSIAP